MSTSSPRSSTSELGVADTTTLFVEQFPGGHSNLTYLVRHGDHEYVLRRPPFGSKVKSAHDMGREVAVLSKLAPVYDRAPKVIAYEPTGDVLGAPFYLMERRRGVILRKDAPTDPVVIARICNLLVDALVDLHAVDYTAAGLGDFGKPVGYVERQVKGWIERYTDSQTDDIAAMASGRCVARGEHAGRRAARADPQRLQVRQRDLRSRARKDHRRARLGDGDDRRSADGFRHRAVVLGAGRRRRRVPVGPVRDHDQARHAAAHADRRALLRTVRPPDRHARVLSTRSGSTRPR